MVIDPYRSKLTAGFDRLKIAEHQLRSKWRFKLLEVYRKKMLEYERETARQQVQMGEINRIMPWVVLVISLLCVGGILLTTIDLTVGILVIGIACSGVFLVVAAYFIFSKEPKRPIDPVRKDQNGKYSKLQEELFPPLDVSWQRKMLYRWPTHFSDHGERGEYSFIHALERALGSDAFVLHRVQQNYGDDLDVILVAQQGIWLFEVKYWSGEIHYRNGNWYRRQTYHKAGGIAAIKEPDVQQPPNLQWKRMTGEVLKTLKIHGKDLLREIPKLSTIYGGIAFTCENAQYHIENDQPFSWGISEYWGPVIRKAPKLKGMTRRTALQIVDLLLARHHELNPEKPVISMDNQALSVIKEVEAGIQKWIKAG